MKLRIELWLQVKQTRQCWQPATIWSNQDFVIIPFLQVGRELLMYCSKWGCKCSWVGESWEDNQRELTDDDECLTIFKKKKRWDVKWCCSSWLEWRSLRTSLVDLNTSYWILVWLLDNFQRSSRELFHDSFKVVLWSKRYLAFSFYISKVCIISTYCPKF